MPFYALDAFSCQPLRSATMALSFCLSSPFLAFFSFSFLRLLSSVCLLFSFSFSFSFVRFLSDAIASGLSYACVVITLADRLVDLFRHPPLPASSRMYVLI